MNIKSTAPLALTAVVMASTLFALPAMAQKKAPSAAAPAPIPNLMTRDELRACLDEKDTLRARDKQHNEQVQAHEANVKRIKDSGKEIAEAQLAVNQADKEQVAQLNARIDAFNNETISVNSRAADLKKTENEMVDSWDKHNEKCAGRPVQKADMDAVTKERQAAGK